MEKELKINIPEGYEIDRENSTSKCIKLKKKPITYDDVAEKLFNNGKSWYIDERGEILPRSLTYIADPNNASSKKQLEKLIAINKLMNVAKYLNGDWKPNWSNKEESKWYITIGWADDIIVCRSRFAYGINVHFRTKELALQAINILGEDTIRLALSTDW